MKNKFYFFIGILFSFFLAGAIEAAPITIALDWVPEPEFGGFYAAENIGLFKKQGLDLKLIPGGAGSPTVQMVAAGSATYGTASASELVIARDRGADLVALFTVYQNSPNCILTHEKKGFKNLKDVFSQDGTIAVGQGQAYISWIKEKYSPIKAKLVPFTGGIAEFIRNPEFSQQGFLFSEPILARKKGVKTKVFMVSESGYNPYTTVLFTRGDHLRKNEKEVKSVVAAVREGWSIYLKNPKSTNEAMAKLNKSMDLETFNEGAKSQGILIETPETHKIGLGNMTSARWNEMAKQLLELKQIKITEKAENYFKNF